MYGYAEDSNLLPEQVLQKVTQEQIFSYILKQPFDFNRRYISPFRNDKNPNCRFEQRPDGAIVFIDFGDKKHLRHRGCFKMVMDRYNLSLDSAVRKVCEIFNLSGNSSDYTKPDNIYVNKVSEDVDNTTIVFESKSYEKKDKLYWSQFLIKTEECLEDQVYSVRKFIKENHKGRVIVYPYGLCYAIDFVDTVKLYQPYNSKYKWITNCDKDDVGNIDNLPPSGDELIIAKSYKDHRVLRNNIHNNVIWLTNEGSIPSIEEILVNLVKRFKRIVIFFDNDLQGFRAMYKLYTTINNIRENTAIMRHLPVRCPWKDPGEFIHKEGRRDFIKIYNQISYDICRSYS